MKTIYFLKQHAEGWWLFLITAFFVILRFPSLFEPYWYGDEGIYQVIGRGLGVGKLLYRDVWDNKPPLLYILYGLVHGDQFGARFLSILFGIGTIIILFLFSRKLFQSSAIAYATTLFFACFFGLPMFEGNIANAENFLVLPSLLSGFVIYSLVKDRKKKSHIKLLLFSAGLFGGLSLSVKVFGLFDFISFLCFFVFFRFSSFRRKDIINLSQELLMMFVGFILPLLLSAIYFLFSGTFIVFFQSIFQGNISYVAWNNTFFIPQGFLVLKVILLMAFVIGLFMKRKYFTMPELFILLWTGFSLFSAFLSQRPYIHYQLVVLPAISFGVGLFFYQRHRLKKLLSGLLVLAVITLLYNNFEHWKIGRTISYYTNFSAFMSGNKNIVDYQSFFDPNTPRDYLLADYIRLHTKPNSTIFVWGNNPQVYVLSKTFPPGRLPTEYHIMTNQLTVEETIFAMNKRPPKYIIIMPNLPSIPFNMRDYRYQGTINGAQIYVYII
jgi:hypothetical protein